MSIYDKSLSGIPAKGNYHEVEAEEFGSGIYTHTCPTCKSDFFGYKRRYLCSCCNEKKAREEASDITLHGLSGHC